MTFILSLKLREQTYQTRAFSWYEIYVTKDLQTKQKLLHGWLFESLHLGRLFKYKVTWTWCHYKAVLSIYSYSFATKCGIFYTKTATTNISTVGKCENGLFSKYEDVFCISLQNGREFIKGTRTDLSNKENLFYERQQKQLKNRSYWVDGRAPGILFGEIR